MPKPAKPGPARRPGAPPAPAPPPDPKYDLKHIARFTDGVAALLGGPLSNNDAQDLTAIAVRMSAWDRDRLLAILTSNAGE